MPVSLSRGHAYFSSPGDFVRSMQGTASSLPANESLRIEGSVTRVSTGSASDRYRACFIYQTSQGVYQLRYEFPHDRDEPRFDERAYIDEQLRSFVDGLEGFLHKPDASSHSLLVYRP